MPRSTRSSNPARQRSRTISTQTRQFLFARSGNQCAHPDCEEKLTVDPTDRSDGFIAANICHIRAVSPGGPRHDPSLTDAQLNSAANLILLCPNHHGLVDSQPETYTSELLCEWKARHEDRIESLASSAFLAVARSTPAARFPTALVDSAVEKKLRLLRIARFFPDFDAPGQAVLLGESLVAGDFACATGAVKGRALAWCARILLGRSESDASVHYLRLARTMSDHLDVSVASALVLSEEGKRQEALAALASIGAPASYSAAIFVVAKHDGWSAAIDWFGSTGFEPVDLDAEGKKHLLHGSLDSDRWGDAFAVADALTEDDFCSMPVLHHFAAMALLLRTVPAAHRTMARGQVPLDARQFPLASTDAALIDRRQARTHFERAAEFARELKLPATIDTNEQYAQWLALRDPRCHEQAKRTLCRRLAGETPHLPFVPLGIQYCRDLDRQVLEREIERQTMLNGEIPVHAALARLAMALTQGTPQKRAAYLEQHHDQLASILTTRSLLQLQIQVLSAAGYPDRAAAALETLECEGLSNQERSFIEATISEAAGDNPSRLLEEQFAQDSSPIVLLRLVQQLEMQGSWDRLATYAGQLFEHTESLPDAERFTRSLAQIGHARSLMDFVRANPSLRTQSAQIRAHYAWALYAEGELLAARRELDSLDANWNDADYRALHVQLGISVGDWRSLSSFVAGEYRRRESRGPADLLTAAKIALNINSSYMKDLTFAAAAKPQVSADILAAAHILAIRGSFDHDAAVAEWFRRASAASGPDGPVRPVSVQELLEGQSHWEEHESQVLVHWKGGDIPTYLTAQALNRRLSQFTLLPAVQNLVQEDPRRCGVIPAFSGARSVETAIQFNSVGVDLTALFTLDTLGILDIAFDSVGEVHIPHATLAFLFEEHFEVSFHQPSRIDDAELLRDLVAKGAVRTLTSPQPTDPDLAAKVGPVAQLIAAAEASEAPAFVVRPRSHRQSSDLDDDGVLVSHAGVLASCRGVVDRLYRAGEITAHELAQARSFLNIRERAWPDNSPLPERSQLYLDGLAISYLMELGLLEKVAVVGPPPVVSSRALQDAHDLLSYARSATQVQASIDRIREALSRRIATGKIQVDRQHTEPSEGGVGDPAHPSTHLFALIPKCDALLVDDRCLNRHAAVSKDGVKVPVITTLEIVAFLSANDPSSSSQAADFRTRLRRAGYVFVPVTEDELSGYVRAATVAKGTIVETAELRAIRENALLARTGQWFSESTDMPWLGSVVSTSLRTIKDLWTTWKDGDDTTARSDWLLDLLDVRGWASPPSDRSTAGGLGALREHSIMTLIDLCIDSSAEVRSAYWNWLEVRVLKPIRKTDPELHTRILEHKKRQVAAVADRPITQETAT